MEMVFFKAGVVVLWFYYFIDDVIRFFYEEFDGGRFIFEVLKVVLRLVFLLILKVEKRNY